MTQRDQDVKDLTEQKPRKSEALPLQQPTYTAPARPQVQEHLRCCGNCPGWKHHALAYGQCLVAIRALGAPMYTSDLGSCGLDDAAIEKALQRR